MYYSSIGLIALFMHFITNYDVLAIKAKHGANKTDKAYRYFLNSVMFYYLSDTLWGLLYTFNLKTILFIDTEIYFVFMFLSVFLWTRYVISYFNKNTFFEKLLKIFGISFLAIGIIIIILNFFSPIVFYIDNEGEYHQKEARYIILIFQILLFLTSSLYTLVLAVTSSLEEKYKHRTVGCFGIVMILAISLQFFYPLLPYYALGCMLGTTLVHSFIIKTELESRQIEHERNLQVQEIQEKELGTARFMAFTDPLTGVKNRAAYLEDMCGIECRINDGLLEKFAVIVFDVNNLKTINDTKGHDQGDAYIREASSIICHTFSHSPVYRIGGDEFAVFIYGKEFSHYNELLQDFKTQMERNLKKGEIVISWGASEYKKGTDKEYKNIFERADKEMYRQKKELKK